MKMGKWEAEYVMKEADRHAMEDKNRQLQREISQS